MAERRWALAPLQGLLLATLVLLAAVGLALWLTLRGPSLGLELKAAGERGVRVVAVSPQGPAAGVLDVCLLYTSPSPRDKRQSRMPSSA